MKLHQFIAGVGVRAGALEKLEVRKSVRWGWCCSAANDCGLWNNNPVVR